MYWIENVWLNSSGFRLCFELADWLGQLIHIILTFQARMRHLISKLVNFQTVGSAPHKLSHVIQMLAVQNWDFVHSSVYLRFPHLLEPILKLTPLRPV